MRIAVILSGQPRDYMTGYKNIKEFLSKQNADVDFFYHCWTLEKGSKYEYPAWSKATQNDIAFKDNIENTLEELYKPVSNEYERQISNFDTSLCIESLAYENMFQNTILHPIEKLKKLNSTLSQMYSRNKAGNLLKNHIDKTGTHYDCVLMTRFDITISPDIYLSSLDLSKTYVSGRFSPRTIFVDNFIIAPTEVILNILNLYNDLVDIVNNEPLSNTLKGLGELLQLNSEELTFAKYILHYNNVDNVRYLMEITT